MDNSSSPTVLFVIIGAIFVLMIFRKKRPPPSQGVVFVTPAYIRQKPKGNGLLGLVVVCAVIYIFYKIYGSP